VEHGSDARDTPVPPARVARVGRCAEERGSLCGTRALFGLFCRITQALLSRIVIGLSGSFIGLFCLPEGSFGFFYRALLRVRGLFGRTLAAAAPYRPVVYSSCFIGLFCLKALLRSLGSFNRLFCRTLAAAAPYRPVVYSSGNGCRREGAPCVGVIRALFSCYSGSFIALAGLFCGTGKAEDIGDG